MLEFHPCGFGKKQVDTSLGSMVYYTQTSEPWDIGGIDKLPPLLFLHNFGGGASAFEWSKVYPAFAHKYRILAPDLIGWGDSDHPVRDYQIVDYLTTIREFIHQTCADTVTVVASSLTAALMIRIAISEPQTFEQLFLVCPAGFNDFGQGASRRLPLPVINLPFVDSLIYGLGAENELAVTNFLQNFLFVKSQRLSQEIVQAYLTSAQKRDGKYSALSFLKGNLYFDLSLYIPQLQVPTIFFWGEQAQFTNVSLGRRLASLNKMAIKDFQQVLDTGILPHLETPGVFIGLLSKYLDSQRVG
ncbi:alpha/beta fold hydrolase [Cylindrospermopsis raciborskii]|uniref:alpha/beta fold hydrolase n=1 Tax=Cylindrospermopsis raciborskii TaxID=77022 RepID=UPI000E1E4882|nr:alpha/beta hydrolase [Cylindrospermopsis raciborskii]UJL33981.1 alpha/beta hydrolase [Cylindrospermopsis raciborskii Cr2010]